MDGLFNGVSDRDLIQLKSFGEHAVFLDMRNIGDKRFIPLPK
jgi:hypothetical protein